MSKLFTNSFNQALKQKYAAGAFAYECRICAKGEPEWDPPHQDCAYYEGNELEEYTDYYLAFRKALILWETHSCEDHQGPSISGFQQALKQVTPAKLQQLFVSPNIFNQLVPKPTKAPTPKPKRLAAWLPYALKKWP